VQVSDRWHLWHGLAEAALKEVAAPSACWARHLRQRRPQHLLEVTTMCSWRSSAAASAALACPVLSRLTSRVVRQVSRAA
jgi:hypothetical protein